MTDTERVIAALETARPLAVRLAELVSLAVRIEPELLRKARLELLPGADAGTEADVWFSELVEVRNPVAVVFSPSVAEVLRGRLREEPERLAAAWAVVDVMHRTISPAVRTEEQLTWLALAGRYDEMRALLRSALATMLSPQRRGLAAWAARAVPRLPEAARNAEEAQMLTIGASLRLDDDGTAPDALPPGPLPEWIKWLTPSDIPTVAVGVRLLDGAVEIGPPGLPQSHRIELPATKPVLVELAWQEANQPRAARLSLVPGRSAIHNTGAEPIELRSVVGQRYTLQRARGPRVHITYEREVKGSVEQVELPFVVGVLGDFTGNAAQSLPGLRDRRFVEVTAENFDAVLASFRPRLTLTLDAAALGPAAGVGSAAPHPVGSLRSRDKVGESAERVVFDFTRLADFEPEHLMARFPPRNPEFLAQWLNAVLHHQAFQRLEASWRGLKYLVDQTPTSNVLKVKVLNVSKDELFADLEKSDGDRGAFHAKVVRDEFDAFGGEPFGVLIGDYPFGRDQRDVVLLQWLSQVAAAACAPFIAEATPGIFGLQSFADFSQVKDLHRIFESPEYLRWNALRDNDDARFLGLVLPPVVQRPLHVTAQATGPFEEEADDVSKYLWGNPAYVFASRVTNAFARYGWCAAIRGFEGGGRADGLPTVAVRADDKDVTSGPTQTILSERRERELEELGFITLMQQKGSDSAAFFGVSSLRKPRRYEATDATGADELSCRFPYVFALARFAQYTAVLARDKIGSFMERAEYERFVSNWLSMYVPGGDAEPGRGGSVYLSYAHRDESIARRLANVLEHAGFVVVLADSEGAGAGDLATEQRRLEDASCVVVLWSQLAHESPFVRREALIARNRDKLLQVRIDDTPLPEDFADVSTADLREWSGQPTDPQLTPIIAALRRRAGTTTEDSTLKARLPLANARVEVAESRGRPGHLVATLSLSPHFQLEPPPAPLQITIELPGMGALKA